MRIQAAYVGNKVVLQEHPTATDLGSRYLTCLRALPQLFRVDAQELSGFSEVEGTQWGYSRTVCGYAPLFTRKALTSRKILPCV